MTHHQQPLPTLRDKAEAAFRAKSLQAAANPATMSPEQTLHELQVHQIELEMQNDELRQAQVQIETSRARYFDLYDMAPIGYCTVNAQGLVTEANVKAATMLGITRSTLVGQPITRFILPDDQDVYYLQQRRPLANGDTHRCELRLIVPEKPPIWVRIEAAAVADFGDLRMVLSDITESKAVKDDLVAVNKTLSDQNIKLQVVFENVLEGIIICGLDGRLQSCNPAALCMHGFATEKEALLNHTDLAAQFELRTTAGRVLPFEEWPISCVLQGKQLQGVEISIQKTGQDFNRILSYHGSIIRDVSGNNLLAIIMVRDITQFKASEKSIKDIALFPEQSPAPIMRIDLSGIFLYGNPASIGFQNQWKFSIGTRVPALWNTLMQRCSADQITLHHETMVGDHSYELTFVPLLSLGYINIYAFDISDRKWIEGELKGARNQLERLVADQKTEITSTKTTLTRETQGRLLAESELSHRQEALEAVYAMETALDSNIESLYDQVVLSIAATLKIPMVGINEYHDGKSVRGSLAHMGQVSRQITHVVPCAGCRAVLKAKRPLQYCGDLEKLFGSDFCFDPLRFHCYAGVPIIGAAGEIFGLITLANDTNKKLQDFEIKFVEIFARYIAHQLSTREMESRLRRVDNMRNLGQLTSGVAHEVRNPLNGILAIMGALSKELSDKDEFKPYMQHMRNQVVRLTVLMEDLLALGRPLREDTMQTVSLVTIVETTLASWQQTHVVGRPAVHFNKPSEPQGYSIKADSTGITQVIINLLDNADFHCPTAEITCSVYKHSDNTIAFAVSDKGTGIPESNLARLFDPFFTTRKGGTGLGLSIVRNIVENHHGTITAHNNTDGQGATFEVLFPLCQLE